jgi:rod shape-determining protein MreC
MFALKRWWGKNAAKLVGATLALGGAGFLWHTQSTLLWETYQTISLPFQPHSSRATVLADSRVQNLEAELAETKAQNQKYKLLLESPGELPGAKIAAPVIGRSEDNWWQHLILGKGAKAGVQVNSIVLSDSGLVGRVTSVTPNTSQVLLATDSTSRIGVLISRTRQMGYIQGNSDRSDQVVFQFFDKTPDVKIGDVVATSTVSQRFPGGLAVGKVVSINLEKTPAPEAIVKLTAPINALEWVRVYSPHKQTTNTKVP